MNSQLVSYIAPAAPATRRPAKGNESFLRPEIGFTPAWFRQHGPLDFSERFHQNPDLRRNSILQMRRILRDRFPGTSIGGVDEAESPMDLLTGTYGACSVAAIYGIPIRYASDNWPTCEKQHLSDQDIARLEPPDLLNNPFFQDLLNQLDWIERSEGRIEGYLNWQGVLNNAHRLRGEQLFTDLMDNPGLCRHLFDCVCKTMIQGLHQLHARQSRQGNICRFATVSNCLVNLVSPRAYEEFLLPLDLKIASHFDCIGIHNCAWNASPYLQAYSRIPNLAYIDMGIHSDLVHAQNLFPNARRAVMYTPMDLANKSSGQIRTDIEHIAHNYAPCDLVLADIDAGTPDDRIREILSICHTLSQ